MLPVELPKVRLVVAIREQHFRSSGRPQGDSKLSRWIMGCPSPGDTLPAALPLLSSERVPVPIKGPIGRGTDPRPHHLPIGAVGAEDAIIAGVIAGPFSYPAAVLARALGDREERRPGQECGEPVRAPDALPEGSTIGRVGEGNLTLLAVEDRGPWLPAIESHEVWFDVVVSIYGPVSQAAGCCWAGVRVYPVSRAKRATLALALASSREGAGQVVASSSVGKGEFADGIGGRLS